MRCRRASGSAGPGGYSTRPRVLATGPGALCTDFGALLSSRCGPQGPGSVDGWAEREAGEELRAWLARFERDPPAAARDFWY